MGTSCVPVRTLQNLSKQAGLLGFGLIIVLGAVFLYIFAIPLLLFRLFLSKIAKWVRPDLKEMVSATGNIFSSDLLSSKSPRCSIIVPFLFEGNLTEEESMYMFSRISTRKDPTTGELSYPQVKQYIEKWFGFAFWKEDPNFSMKNHLITYTPEEHNKSVSVEEATRYVEKLLNQQFVPGRSPWEIHLVPNYEDPDVSPGKNMLVILRVHHTMADGYSIMYVMMEGALETSVKTLDMPTPKYYKRRGWDAVWNNLMFPFRLMIDVSNYFVKGFRKSDLNIPDGKKDWKQIYAKTRPVSIEKIKEIKTILNVSFTSVLLAAVSGSLSRVIRARNKEMNKVNGGNRAERAAFFIPLPLQGHPDALKNHVTGAQIDLPLDNYSDPRNRVFECERLLQEQKKSTIPWLLIFLARSIGVLPSELCGQFTANRVNIAGLTSFSAGNKEIRIGLGNRKVLAVDAAVGALTGISGAAFMAISYKQDMRFGITAETSALSRQEIEGLLALLTDEIDLLYDILKTTSTSN